MPSLFFLHFIFSLHKMSQLSFHTKHHHLRRIHHILYLEFLLPESSIGSPFCLLIHFPSDQQNAGKGYQDLSEEVKKEPEDEGSKSKVDIPIDFAALKEKNPDVYAWISIPGTAIDYPVLQRENDNTYYLDHTIDHEEKTEGAIFTENYNNTDFEDPNTVIYGHDMRNGSMFKGLLDYRDKTFFDQNKEVLIYTPDAIRHYKIFAAYPYDSRHLLRSFDFTDKEVYQQYLYRIFAIRDMNASIDTTAQVGTDDKILTLSTCYANQPDMRFLVQAVLVSIEQ